MSIKEKIANLSQLKRMVLLGVIVAIALIGLSCIFLIWDMWDWIVGVTLGSVIEIICIVFLYLGTDLSTKNKSYASFALFYILRMALYVAGLLVAALLTYYFEIKSISVFGVLIGYAPMQIVVVLASLKERHEINKVESMTSKIDLSNVKEVEIKTEEEEKNV